MDHRRGPFFMGPQAGYSSRRVVTWGKLTVNRVGCKLVPLARIALVVFVLSFAVLVVFCAPGLSLGDSGELTTAALGLGVAHETGTARCCLVAKALPPV